MLIIGGGYAPYCDAWKEYRDLAHKHDIPAYPCINCSFVAHFKSVEMLRGVATNWWYEGALGIYLFNPFVPVDGDVIPAETMYGEFATIGDPKTLVGLDKLFCQDHVENMTYTSNMMMNRMTAPAPLPMPVSATAKTIPLLVAEFARIRGKGPKMTLELQTQPAEASAGLVVRLNEQPLAMPGCPQTR